MHLERRVFPVASVRYLRPIHAVWEAIVIRGVHAVGVACRPSAYHNTIRARVATVAGVSALFTAVYNSVRWSMVSSIHESNTKQCKISRITKR